MKNRSTSCLLVFFLLTGLIGTIGCEDEPAIVNNAPTIIGQTFTIAENSAPGTLVGNVRASDPDLNDLTYAIVNQAPSNAFDIDQTTGELTVSGNVTLSFEEVESYTLTIRVSDGEAEVEAMVVIDIIDLPEEFQIVLRPAAQHGKDAILYDLKPDNNYGEHPQINAQAWTNSGTPQTMRGLIQFDYSIIPDGVTIQQMSLSLYHHVASSNPGHSQTNGSNESTLRRVTENWDENAVTWNSQPGTTDMGAVTLPASSTQDQDYLDIDVTSLAINAEGELFDNFGFMLSLNTETYYRSLVFASSDVDDKTIHPKLVIRYID